MLYTDGFRFDEMMAHLRGGSDVQAPLGCFDEGSSVNRPHHGGRVDRQSTRMARVGCGIRPVFLSRNNPLACHLLATQNLEQVCSDLPRIGQVMLEIRGPNILS
jgi:hypothetical protein